MDFIAALQAVRYSIVFPGLISLSAQSTMVPLLPAHYTRNDTEGISPAKAPRMKPTLMTLPVGQWLFNHQANCQYASGSLTTRQTISTSVAL